MEITTKSKTLLRIQLIAVLVEAGLGLLSLFLIPSDPQNAWVLGLSKSRLVMVFAWTLLSSVVTFFVVKTLRNETWLDKLGQGVEQMLQADGHLISGFVFSLAGLVGGSYFLYVAFTTTDLYQKGYFIRLAPWVFWLTAFCAQTLTVLIFADIKRFWIYLRAHGLTLLAFFAVLVAGLVVHLQLGAMDYSELEIYSPNDQIDHDIKEQDIYLVYQEGLNLLNGENPYARASKINENRWNAALPTYLPSMYYGSLLTHLAGIDALEDWLSVWKGIFLFFNLAIAYLVFYVPTHRYDAPVLGLVAAALWLFNRWTLHVTTIAHFNFIPIFFFVLSLGLLPKRPIWSYLFFGLSLSLKHNAIFMGPIYLIWAWKREEENRLRNLLTAGVAMAAVPLLVSFPFLIQDLIGFVKSLSISLTRYPETHIGVLSLDALFGWVGLPAKIPLILMILASYLVAWRTKLGYFAAGLLIMTIFVDFHSVLFRHYMAWIVPLVLLTISESIILPLKRSAQGQAA